MTKNGCQMRDRVFQDAYDRVRARFSDEAWLAMQPGEITRAIYDEMRSLDSERTPPDPPASPGRPRAGEQPRNGRS